MFTNGDFHVSVDRWQRYDEADDETFRRWNNEMRMGVRRYGIRFWVFKRVEILCVIFCKKKRGEEEKGVLVF